jgi:hypothetical protein
LKAHTQTTKLSLISTIFTLLFSTGLAAKTNLRADVDAALSQQATTTNEGSDLQVEEAATMDAPANKVQNEECKKKANAVSTSRNTAADRGLATSAAMMTTLPLLSKRAGNQELPVL